MKVSELLNKLKSCPPNADVICYQENTEKNLLDIEDISVEYAIKGQNDNYEPTLKFMQGENSKEHVIITVTSDF